MLPATPLLLMHIVEVSSQFLSQALGVIVNACALIDLSTLDKEQKQHQRQTRDGTVSQAKTRQRLEAEHAELVAQKRAAANAAKATKVMQLRNLTSRQNATETTNDQRR